MVGSAKKYDPRIIYLSNYYIDIKLTLDMGQHEAD